MELSEAGLPKAQVEAMTKRETDRYIQSNPISQQLGEAARANWIKGVPHHWMLDWSTPFPLFVADAKGATLTDADGHTYDDFCLGDTGSMFGHSPEPVAKAIAAQASHGLTYMLPTEDIIAVGKLLEQMFGLPQWQVTTTATDANRFVIRWCRAITKRTKVLVFHGAYHGAVDDTFVRLKNGKPIHRLGLIGQVYDLTTHTKVVEFNDVPALEAALKDRDVACVITEPALTNIGMVLPQPGFLDALQDLCRKTETLLVIDETHTISTGYGGYTRTHKLKPDFLTLGKPVAGGLPTAVFGCTAEIAARMRVAEQEAGSGYSGMGTTLSANALQFKAMRANLEHVMTPAAYDHMLPLSEKLARGIEGEIRKRSIPWHVSNVGARAEFVCAPERPRNGTEAQAAMHGPVELAVHLYLLNRGLLIAPFHNMTLVSPVTTPAQVDRLVATIGQCLDELAA
ncbi:aspartate aminotransferase family protein [Dongia mobilis]|jgi:glutamate-1-semialdehyde 2,1-aminomutase|uniref:aspartate aminotransferase family protein n=1 Tax=Dongia sp. TaxID=1977262 RepID=UPI0026E9B166